MKMIDNKKLVNDIKQNHENIAIAISMAFADGNIDDAKRFYKRFYPVIKEETDCFFLDIRDEFKTEYENKINDIVRKIESYLEKDIKQYVFNDSKLKASLSCLDQNVIFEHSDDLIELSGDLTPAYERSCEKVIRKFTFKPNEGQYGVLKIEDEVTSKNEKAEKQFHIHMQEEPEINGNEFIIKHKGGMLKGKVIEPLNAKIEAIGGEGKKYFTAGQFLENDSGLPDAKECGWGQIIISPNEFNKTDKFVVEMEIMDRE